MPDETPLSDDEVHDRLVEASYALGTAPGATTRGDTALQTARRILLMLQFGLVKAIDDNSDDLGGVTSREPSPRPPPD